MAVQRSPKPPMGVRFPPTLPRKQKKKATMKIIEKAREYLKGVGAEAKRVTWPNRHELWESTLVVIAFIFILSATTLVYDKVIEMFIKIVHMGA